MERKNKIKYTVRADENTSGKTRHGNSSPYKKPSVGDLRPIRSPELESKAKPSGRWTPPNRQKHKKSSKAYIAVSLGVLSASVILTVLGFLNLVPVTFGVAMGLLAMIIGLLMIIKIK